MRRSEYNTRQPQWAISWRAGWNPSGAGLVQTVNVCGNHGTGSLNSFEWWRRQWSRIGFVNLSRCLACRHHVWLRKSTKCHSFHLFKSTKSKKSWSCEINEIRIYRKRSVEKWWYVQCSFKVALRNVAEKHTRPLTLSHGGQQFLPGHHLHLVDKADVKCHHGNSGRLFDHFHAVHGQDAVDRKLWVPRSEVCARNNDLKVGVFIQFKLNSVWQACNWVSKMWQPSMTLIIWRRMICIALPRGSRSVKNNMTHVALQGRGQLAPITVFQLQVCSLNLKFFATVERGSTKTTLLQHGSSIFGDTHANGGGGGSRDKHGYMAFLIRAKWERQDEDLCRPDNAPC